MAEKSVHIPIASALRRSSNPVPLHSTAAVSVRVKVRARNVKTNVSAAILVVSTRNLLRSGPT